MNLPLPRPVTVLGLALILLLASYLAAAEAGKRPPKPKFAPAVAYPAGFDPTDVAAADFDGDGKTDLATSNFAASGGSSGLSILRGTGKGRFAPAGTLPAPVQSDGIEAAILPGDNDPDLVVAGYGGGEVDIYRGGPGAGFQAPERIDLTTLTTRGLVVDFFDSDEIPDIAVGLSEEGRIAVLRGLANGGYAPPVNLNTNVPGTFIGPLASGDLDGDGDADLVAARSGGVVLSWLSNGDGTFAAPQPRPVGDLLLALDLGNIDGNAKLDLVVSRGVGGSPFRAGRGISAAKDRIMVLRGNGDGTFRPGFSRDLVEPSGAMTSLAIGDFDRDGRDDVVTGWERLDQVALLRGRKKGRLTAPSFRSTSDPAEAVLAAPLNKDKRLDLAVVGPKEAGGGHVDVLLQKKPKK